MIITDEKILRAPNEDVDLEEGMKIIRQLEKELIDGIGLAAPQIGINKRVAIIRFEENIDIINPKIIDSYGIRVSKNEGCLSIPNTYIDIYRFKEIFVKDDLHPDGFVAVGDISIILQHEIDHLNGVLIIDKIINGKLGRNDPCPCGKMENGKPLKFKKCHGKE